MVNALSPSRTFAQSRDELRIHDAYPTGSAELLETAEFRGGGDTRLRDVYGASPLEGRAESLILKEGSWRRMGKQCGISPDAGLSDQIVCKSPLHSHPVVLHRIPP